MITYWLLREREKKKEKSSTLEIKNVYCPLLILPSTKRINYLQVNFILIKFDNIRTNKFNRKKHMP